MLRKINREVKTVKPKVGKNLPQVLSRTLVRDTYAAVSELVCNSYDEDAEQVHIDIDKGLGTLTITDDGNGMDKKGLENFFRLGDSEKLRNPRSPRKKRNRVGKYGIAKVLIQYLGRSFSVESVKDRQKYIVDEGVTAEDITVKSIPVSRKVKNGTKIIIRDLRFAPESVQFQTQKLYSRLQWDPPNVPDFDVFLDGQLVKKRGAIQYASTYRVEKDIGDGNIVRGRIYYLKSGGQKKLEGIRIYVNNRAVGDPGMFDVLSISRSLPGRIQGIIHADFLEDLITLDRSEFQEDERLDKTKQAVIEVLHGIIQDIDHNAEAKHAFYTRRERLHEHIERALASSQFELNKRLGTQYSIVLTDQTKAGPVARLEPKTNTILINAQNKMFTFMKKEDRMRSRKHSEVYLRRAFLVASALAISKQQHNDGRFEGLVADRVDETFEKFEGIARIMNRYNEEAMLVPLDSVYFNPYRLYDDKEISAMTGRPSKVIRLLHTSGALKGTEEHFFERDAILRALSPLEGYVSCIELLNPEYAKPQTGSPKGVRVVYQANNIKRGAKGTRETKLDRTIYLYEIGFKNFGVVNVGVNHPLYFVPSDKKDAFCSFVRDHRLYNPNPPAEPIEHRSRGKPRKSVTI